MKKVLIVDDEKDIVAFLSECLATARYQVETAGDGRTGLERAKTSAPDLVILDIMMPDMHGFEVCKELRSDKKLKKTKILISTGKSYAVDRKAALNLGADLYLTKPYTVQELLEAVRSLIGVA